MKSCFASVAALLLAVPALSQPGASSCTYVYTGDTLSTLREELKPMLKDGKMRKALYDDTKVSSVVLTIKSQAAKVVEISFSLVRPGSSTVEFVTTVPAGDDFDLMVAKLGL